MSMTRFHIRFISAIALFLVISVHGFGQKDFKIKKLSIEGNETLKDADIKSNMNTKAKTFTKKLMFWEKAPRFSNITFEDDLNRVTRYYQRNGFLSPKIDFTLNKKENSKALRIVIKIKEGESVHVDKLVYQLDNARDSLAEITLPAKELPIKSGDRFQDEKVKAFEAYLQKKYSDCGYPFPKVKTELLMAPQNNSANLSFSIDPGVKCNFGKTWIKSDSLVPLSFIRNQLKYKEGDPYSKDDIEKSQKKLFDTELFQFVVIRTLVDSIKNSSVPMLIQMKEKPRWLLETGVGYGSEDRFRISAQVTRRQFFGGARKLIFTGKRSYYLPVSLELSFIQPDIFKDNLDFILNPYFIWENETSYDVKRLGSGVTLKNDFNKHTSAYLMYTFEKDWFSYKSDPVEVNEQDSLPYNKSGITLGFTHTTTDDLFDPTKGTRINAYYTLMGLGFDSKYHYMKLEIDIRKYFPMTGNKVLASKIRWGVMDPIMGDLETPVEDRFMLGGALSLRGWGRNQISPVNEYGDLVGGNSMIEASAELRFPIYDILSGGAFIDSGNVWADPLAIDFTDLRTDLGFGIRAKTPIGPVRVDFATPVFEQFHAMFFFSIGHAF
jgi:outer membrane protein assembly complex protein YaeT